MNQHGLLSRLLGTGYGNQLEGGDVQTSPDGNITNTPYKTRHPILDALFNSGQGSASANLYNARLAETRLDRSLEGKNTIEQEKEKAVSAIKIANNAATIAAAEKAGIPAFDEKGNLTDAYIDWVHKVSPIIVANAKKRGETISQIMEKPEFGDSLAQGMFAENRTPAVKNAADLKTVAPEGTVATMPVVPGVNDTAPIITSGATRKTVPITTLRDLKTDKAITQELGFSTDLGEVRMPITVNNKKAVETTDSIPFAGPLMPPVATQPPTQPINKPNYTGVTKTLQNGVALDPYGVPVDDGNNIPDVNWLMQQALALKNRWPRLTP